ncbi:MAG: VCBS repeat-containing protein [Verrucomicrobiales bacterium]
MSISLQPIPEPTRPFLRGADDGTFGTPSTLNAGSQPQDVALGDFDEDGNLDFAVADSSGSQVIVRLGSGGGVFGRKSPLQQPNWPMGSRWSI